MNISDITDQNKNKINNNNNNNNNIYSTELVSGTFTNLTLKIKVLFVSCF